MNCYTIDVIAGGGIVRDVVPAAIRCIDELTGLEGFEVVWRERDWGSERYLWDGATMPPDGIDELANGDGILLGAVGAPGIPDHVTLWGLLIPIRRPFLQYVNLRPVRLLPGVRARVAGAENLDAVIVRENVEGEYSEIDGRAYDGRPEGGRFSKPRSRERVSNGLRGSPRISLPCRSARLVSATKSNGILHTMLFWDGVVRERVAADSAHIGISTDE